MAWMANDSIDARNKVIKREDCTECRRSCDIIPLKEIVISVPVFPIVVANKIWDLVG
jgi:hypothetical protein